MAEHKPAFCH